MSLVFGKKKIESLTKALMGEKKILILVHKNPDGDALGASLGLLAYLKNKKHEVSIISPTTYSESLNWMPYLDELIVFDDSKKELIEKKINSFDIIFLLDFNNLSRISPLDVLIKKSNALKVLVDHHVDPLCDVDISFLDINAPSTTFIIYNLIRRLEKKIKGAITKNIATCLYTGLLTDTGRFQFSTSSATHLLASILIREGADLELVHSKLYKEKSFEQLALLGDVLKTLKVVRGHAVSYMFLDEATKEKNLYKKGHSEDFVNYCLNIKDVCFCAFFIEEKKEGIVKISFRSKGMFDVNYFAKTYFSGGGHKNAAGGMSTLSLKKTIERFLHIIKSESLLINIF